MDDEALLAQDLENHLIGGEPFDPDDPGSLPEAETWQPRNENDANRMLRLLARATAERATIARMADAEIAKVKEWAEDRMVAPNRAIDWAQRQLENWARANWTDPTKGHDFKLPNGVIKLRVGQPSLVVDDTEVAATELRSMDRYDLLKVTVAAGELKKVAVAASMSDEELEGVDTDLSVHEHVVVDGALIPGTHLETPARHTITITPKK